MKKTTPRVKSPEEVANETEFGRRYALPGVEARYMSAGRTFDVVLSARGVDVAWKTETTKRGRVSSVHYFFPSLEAYTARMAPPVAR